MFEIGDERVGWHTERVKGVRKKRKIDLTYHYPVDEIEVARLWKGVIVQAVEEARWRDRIIYLRKRIPKNAKRLTTLRVRRWCYSREARKWIMSNSREFNSFLFLCEVCDLKPTPIREFVMKQPDGWRSTDIVLGKLKQRSNKSKEVCNGENHQN